MTLVPLPGEGLVTGAVQPIADYSQGSSSRPTRSSSGRWGEAVRLYVPLLDGTDRIGVLVFTLDHLDDDDRRLARRLAGLVADMIVT